ncbi:hypothetical protein CLOM_g4753 [Closterium sp. NIES-68]|nr:hypothetical protein CLOM_g4753 [Closterium sp. NIES-68]GJP81209.1 hypothetical protein CLOP_g11376 [Closterium sp. NIES-67]
MEWIRSWSGSVHGVDPFMEWSTLDSGLNVNLRMAPSTGSLQAPPHGIYYRTRGCNKSNAGRFTCASTPGSGTLRGRCHAAPVHIPPTQNA